MTRIVVRVLIALALGIIVSVVIGNVFAIPQIGK